MTPSSPVEPTLTPPLALEGLPLQGMRWSCAAPGSASGPLFVLLPDAGGDNNLLPLREALLATFKQSVVYALQAPLRSQSVAAATACSGWQDAAPGVQLSDAVQALIATVMALQAAESVAPQATALAGFSQGATLALASVFAHDGLAGRVLAFSPQAQLPAPPVPTQTTLHWLHGQDDSIVPPQQAGSSLQTLVDWGADATLDISSGVGHTMHAALIACAIERLRSYIPTRTWAQALGAAR